ncbi:hypothetical protein M427DRAFT_438929 [Gonapodya prolifera JEL478]|uniref:Uncharacterized protein n=1 Tax=Gonapodya prolifera (strain JEL478) TaxID=1344416 RepID=A0A139A3F7_GONPJ|nr:hypothetical protein M427DRAFT_438929 [Gonapodya prolifera JEL478]|eukprot:KXS11347.1 hypothetical protein M427DRAFT_438929 [Gonapodya prolifera JEL478]
MQSKPISLPLPVVFGPVPSGVRSGFALYIAFVTSVMWTALDQNLPDAALKALGVTCYPEAASTWREPLAMLLIIASPTR